MVMPTARVIIVSGPYVLVETKKNEFVGKGIYSYDDELTTVTNLYNRTTSGLHFSWEPYVPSDPTKYIEKDQYGKQATFKGRMLREKDMNKTRDGPQPPGGEYHGNARDGVIRELGEEIGVAIAPRFFRDAGNHGGIDYFTMRVEDTQAARRAFEDRFTALSIGTEIFAITWAPLSSYSNLERIYNANTPSNQVVIADIQNSKNLAIMCQVTNNTAGVCSGGGGCGGGGCSSSARPGGTRRSTRRRRALRKTRKAYI